MPSPHVCMVCCQHVPDDVRVTHKMGMAMTAAGFRVTWVGPERPRSGPDYGIDFTYYPITNSKLDRLLRFRHAEAAAGSLGDVDVYYAPEPDSAYVVNRLARKRGAKSIFDIHEVYHEEMLGRWAGPKVRPLASRAVKAGMQAICARANVVVAVSRAVMAPYRDVPTDKLIVRNCAPRSFGEGAPADVFGGGRPLTIMHGKATLGHGTRVVIEAIGRVRQTVPEVRAVMFNAFEAVKDGFGEGDFWADVQRVEAKGSVDLRAQVPLAEVAAILRGCDVGLVAYDRTWGVNSLPNKLFEYMGAGVPVIAPKYSSEIGSIVESERCGLLVDCERAEEIADAILWLHSRPEEARAMGRRGREAFLARHNWQSEVSPQLDRIRAWTENGGR